MLQKFEVGQLFQPGITHYQEGGRFDFDASGAVLLLTWERPSSKEVQEIKSGTFSAGLTVIDNIIFLLFRFGTGPWMDFPFSPHLMADKDAEPLEPGATQGYGLTVFLVDAGTGILKVGRLIGLSHEFSEAFREAFFKTKNMPFNRAEYDRMLSGIYNAYSTEQLLQIAMVRI